MTEGDGKELMWEFQTTGSVDSGRRLFAMYRKPLLRFLIALCGSESEADDLSQRVWLKIIEVAKRGGYRRSATATFRTYLFTVARNLFIDEVRSQKTKGQHDGGDSLSGIADRGVPSMEALTDSVLASSKLYAAMREIPPEQREVLTMWAEGFSFDEIAAVVGAPRNTVIGRKRYGLEKLQAALDAAQDGPGDNGDTS